MRRSPTSPAVTLLFLALTAATPMDAQRLTTAQAMQLPSREADHRLFWGLDPIQFGDLRLPDGPGPHPVAVLIHGGCWLSAYSLHYMGAMADALKAAGIASWNVEYRRVGDAGGGWPGTLLDAGHAIDDLRFLATKYPLDLSRVVLSGHSAGGHLALWAAARHRLPAGDPLRGDDPLPIRGVVALAPLVDLAASVSDTTPLCDRSAIQLLGGTPAEVPDRYAQTSPAERLPLGIRYAIVQGADDPLVPAAHVTPFVEAARRAGDEVQLELVPDAGHFELVAPGTAAFAIVLGVFRTMLEVAP